MKIFEGKRLYIKSWCNNPEQGALDQAMNLSGLPFTYHHIALMPDTHQGYGMPIGGVIATEGVVIPNAVGVDIGCGMCAVKTKLKIKDIKTHLIDIVLKIKEVVPVGFNKHKEGQNEILNVTEMGGNTICCREYENAAKSIGTLGGGNHFIEIQKDEEEYIWIMIHSGSRNLGKQVADNYNKIAINLNNKFYSVVEKNIELAFLPIETREAKNYLNEMKYCVDFALANRYLIMKRVLKIFQDIFYLNGGQILGEYGFDSPKDNGIINIAHNYARWENHFGKNVIVHRKGATSAKAGEIGIIPGSQGTSSYIVEGLGNKESFESCSHGAGRAMGRRQAVRELNFEDEVKRLNDKGILHNITDKKDLDEASGAYKDIDIVMEEQKDLVKILVKLEPLAVIKG